LCHYNVRPPNSGSRGDLIYVRVNSLSNVKAYVYMGDNMADPNMYICEIYSGDYIAAVLPN
jgi:hypothetical protein